jgi:hypothetical protein
MDQSEKNNFEDVPDPSRKKLETEIKRRKILHKNSF